MDSPTWLLLSLFVAFELALTVSETSIPQRIVGGKAQRSQKPKRSGDSGPHKWERVSVVGSADDGSRRTKAKCVDIPQTMGLCRGIGYMKMRLPNLLEHESLSEVQQEAASWTPLLSARCNPNTQLFLCSLFSPVCLDEPIWPCRSLCLEVKRGCEARMASHGYSWPDMLDCEKLPSDNDLCIGIQANRSSVNPESHSTCRACQGLTASKSPNIVENFCEAEFVAKVKLDMAVISGNDLKIIPKKKIKFFKSPHATARFKRRQGLFIPDGAKCDCFDTSGDVNYIIMGHLGADKQRVTVTSVFDAKSKAWRQALRVAKKSNACVGTERWRLEVMNVVQRNRKSSGTANTKSREGIRNNGKKSPTASRKATNRQNNRAEKERRRKESKKLRNKLQNLKEG